MVEQEIQQEKEAEFIKLMIIVAVFVLLIVGTTFGFLFGLKPSEELKTWVDTATIFTGVATPILSTVSVFLLYFVWKDNRRELAETKKALIEQSDTQNFSVIKDALFEIAEQIQILLAVEVILASRDIEFSLSPNDGNTYKSSFISKSEHKECSEIMLTKVFLKQYFFHMKTEKYSDKKKECNYKALIFSGVMFPYIEKVKTLALFMRALKSMEYRGILEITLFSKLTIFTWLFFVEIAFHLLKTAKVGEKETAELVFAEIAGLTCRQLKEVYWIDALSDEVLLELKARKLL